VVRPEVIFAALRMAIAAVTAIAVPVYAGQSPAAKRARRMSKSTSAHISTPTDASETPAVRYAKLSQDDCEAELTQRGIEFTRETGDGVAHWLAPWRGVSYRSVGGGPRDQPLGDR